MGVFGKSNSMVWPWQMVQSLSLAVGKVVSAFVMCHLGRRQFAIMCSLCLLLTIDMYTSASDVNAVPLPVSVPAAPVGTGGTVSPRTNVHFCVRGEVACTSGRRNCIPEMSYCDGKKDCDDGSDEGEHCVNYDCGETRGKCPNKRLCTFRQTWWPDNDDIYHPREWYLCNGVVDCRDGSDERASYCRSFNCSRYQQSAVKCPNGVECLWIEGDDEADDPVGLLCDGVRNCKDGSDEAASYCRNRNCSDNIKYPYQGYIRCDGGRCVNNQAYCNGTFECQDRSDEKNCASRPCPDRFKKCRDGRTCVFDFLFCDGHRDCPDGSDESDFSCEGACPDPRKRRCANNATCIARTKFCDGVNDCPDGSDESPSFAGCPTIACNNSNNEFQCPSGPASSDCLPAWSFCDGTRNCVDGSDENIVNCRRIPCWYPEEIKCRDGSRCMSPNEQCNGRNYCRDKYDENPAFCRNYTCPSGMTTCPSGVGCLDSPLLLCDGRRQCLDGSDESRAACSGVAACDDGKVLCRSPRRCKDGVYCDGVYDCRDGSDERADFCRNFTCPRDNWKCRNNLQCIESLKVCDGRRDCRDGSDELSSFCRSFNCTSLEGTGDSRFKCPTNNSRCVGGALCDGYASCPDGSDENAAFCRAYTCPRDKWKCGNRVRCIDKESVCDGNNDCGDNSDEAIAFCRNWTCPSDRWKCRDGSKCIRKYSDLCESSGFQDCPDGSDQWDEVCETINCADFGRERCATPPNRCC